MKIIRLKNNITVILNDGTFLTNDECTDALYNEIVNNQDNDVKVKCLMIPEFCKKEEEVKEVVEFLENLEDSDYLTVSGSSIYIKSISELTVPTD